MKEERVNEQIQELKPQPLLKPSEFTLGFPAIVFIFLWGCSVLCIAGYFAASLASTCWMTGPLFSLSLRPLPGFTVFPLIPASCLHLPDLTSPGPSPLSIMITFLRTSGTPSLLTAIELGLTYRKLFILVK